MSRLAAPSARLYANMRGSVEIVGAAYVHVQVTRSGREARLTGVFCTASGLRAWAVEEAAGLKKERTVLPDAQPLLSKDFEGYINLAWSGTTTRSIEHELPLYILLREDLELFRSARTSKQSRKR